MAHADTLLRRFARDLRDLLVDGPSPGFLVAVSGGPDSTALLHLLLRAARPGDALLAPARLVVGHVNHGLRGADSDGDQAFVEELARRRGVPVLTGRLETPQPRSSTGLAAEDATRSARYDLLGRWARNEGLKYILTGHHAADQRETVLLRIARGTGVSGLAGIPARRRLVDHDPASPILLRPLLAWERRDLLGLLEHWGEAYREDRSNRDVRIPRNAVRHDILPRLAESVHPGAGASLLRLAGLAAQVERDLELLLDERWPALRPTASDCGSRLALSREALEALPPSLRVLALRRVLRAVAGDRKRPPPPIDERRMREISRRLLGGESGRDDSLRLRGGWLLRRRGDLLELDLEERAAGQRASHRSGSRSSPHAGTPRRPDRPTVDLPAGPETPWGPWILRLQPLGEAPPIRDPDPWSEVFDLEAIPGSLSVRARRPGDRFHPLGAPGTKRLKEFLRERGIPASLRDDVPLVVAGESIVWVVGHRLAHACRVKAGTRRWARLTAWRGPE